MKNLLLAITFSLSAVLSAHAQTYPEMISVTGGTFEMGDSEGIGEANEQPVHAVTLKGFSISLPKVIRSALHKISSAKIATLDRSTAGFTGLCK